MRLNKRFLFAGALAMSLGTLGFSANAAQRSDRDGHQGRARAREGSSESRDADHRREDRQANNGDRGNRDRETTQGAQREPQRQSREVTPERRGDDRGRTSAESRRYDRNDRNWRGGEVRRPAPRRYYGSGGHLSVYFGLGSGYRYGAPYSGRVYGYVGRPGVYGARRYYGDVRLLVRPRNAAVYVDGYYAGVVDDFDGVFQRLTLEVGPHQIDIEAPGLEPRTFDVYVDPSRTVDLHGDLLGDGRY